MKLKHKYWRKKLLPVFAVALASLYIFSFLITDLVHPLVHNAEYSNHTAADEQDPCHLEIYHGVKENSTSHHTHLTVSNDKCWLCDIVFVHEHLRPGKQIVSATENTNIQKAFLLTTTSLGFNALAPARAPPVLT